MPRPERSGGTGHAESSFSWGASRTGECPQNVMPDVLKNHTEEVNQTAGSALNSSPPSTGMLQRGRLGRGSTSILATNTPYTKQPASECASTRGDPSWKPSAYRQCTATGTVSSTATRPDQRCNAATQPAPVRYRATADSSWTSTSANAAVASQVFAAGPLEKPATDRPTSVGSCSRP